MSKDHRLSKVEILCQQNKFSEAEKILKDMLSQGFCNVELLGLFAEINLLQEKFEVAKEVIESAIGLAPDNPYLFFVRGRIALWQENYEEAEMNLKHSIKLDPRRADFFALLAHIKLERKDFEEALTLADQALELEAENLQGLNARSSALLKLNRKEESFDTIEGALRQAPNNSYTHANYGWGLLEKGEHQKAKVHFKESLKNDPNLEFAQAGLLQAIKATNPIYRMYLKYDFFMGNLNAKFQWSIVIGLYLSMKGLQYLAGKNEALQPYLNPLLTALAIIMFSTWVIHPVSNLFLRFNKYGQFLLTKSERMSSNFVAVSFVIFITGVGLYLFTKEEKFLAVAFFGFAMMVPSGVVFSPSKHKLILVMSGAFLFIVGLLAIYMALKYDVLFNIFSIIFIYSFIGLQFLTNYLLIKEDNK